MNFEEYYKIGETYYENGKYEEALIHFKKCVSIDNYYNCLNYIGLCYIRLKKYEWAIKTFKEIKANCPQSSVPIVNLGRTYLYKGILPKAFELFNEAIEVDPSDYDAYFYLGVYYEKLNNFQESIKCYEKSLSINFEQSETHLNLGICYLKLNFCDKACEEFKLAYRYDNECIEAKENIALIYIAKKDYQNAIKELLIFNAVRQNDIVNLIDIAHCYYKLNDFQKAYNWITKALLVDSKNEYANRMFKKLQSKLN